ncbi:MAG: hypothetical protein CMM91_05070 [Rickettsiales bacterium]|nr:hypothetical protein [Rickettsiales bacterium]OUV53834.1 MAG: hypothetical protein CBC87_03810 [Rickettsiales bacterium TMED127]|tara:strand:- start:3167 stop:3430 length:264 start_codon:yes stop_codon:yes gene_type:complete
MQVKSNIIFFPDKIEERKNEKEKKYAFIRDKIETHLTNFSKIYGDEWAVALAAGRYSSMRLQQMDGSDSTIDFFKKCIETEEKNKKN